jgi:glycosyltransferase involved in cell wall biosynthesis
MVKACHLSSVHIALDNRIFYREARSLQQTGYEVTVVAIHDHDEIRDGIEIIALRRSPRWRRPLLWLTLFRRALSTGADCFHFHDPELLLVAPWLRLLTRKPIIYDVHEANADFLKAKDDIPGWLRHPLASVVGRMEPLLARLQSGLIFADDQIASLFHHIHCPKTTLYNYPGQSLVDLGRRVVQQSARKRPIVLHLGGHKRGRGPHLMLEAFQQVLRVVPDARLLLVGHFVPANLEQQIRRGIADRGMDGAVTVTGQVPFEQVGAYLEQAAVGWVPLQPIPKYQKNIPTKLFEYMAYGIPVVSSDLLPIRPFVQNGANGYRVTADDPVAHAQAIIEILTQPGLASAMGRRGQELVQMHYNWGQIEERLLALYAQLLS